MVKGAKGFEEKTLKGCLTLKVPQGKLILGAKTYGKTWGTPFWKRPG